MRQKSGSAKGGMFITLEDETGIANLVIWPQLFEKQRRLILSASMLGVEGRAQREGEVVHVVTYRLLDLSEDLRGVGQRGGDFVLQRGRGDEATHGGGPDARGASSPKGRAKPRDIYIPDLALGSGIKIPTRDFR